MENKTNKSFVVITGMHRSGTSYLSRALNICGLHLGPIEDYYDTEFNPKIGNPRGHWENKNVNKLNNEILELNNGTWSKLPLNLKNTPQHFEENVQDILNSFYDKKFLAYGFKDPRILITLDKWTPLLPSFIIAGIFRHPLKVAESLKIRNGLDYNTSISLWETYNQNLLRYLKKFNGFLLDFDWSKERLIKETKSMSSKIGLLDLDISFWFSEQFKKSDKSFNEKYPLTEKTLKIYSELKEVSINNKNFNYVIPKLSNHEIYDVLQNYQSNFNSFYFEATNIAKNEILKIEKDYSELFGEGSPLSSLILYYSTREDLQKSFPEVSDKGDFTLITKWILDVFNGTITGEEEARKRFSKSIDWFKDFYHSLTSLQNELTKNKDKLTSLEQDKTSLQNELTKNKDKLTSLEQDKTSLQNKLTKNKNNLSHLEKDVLLHKTEKKQLKIKNYDLLNAHNNSLNELNAIKSSTGFKLTRFFGSKLDRFISSNSNFRRSLLIIPYSFKIIKNEGIKSYIQHSKNKLQRKDFTVTPISSELKTRHKLSKTQLLMPYISPIKIRETIQSKFFVSVVIPTNSNVSTLTPVIEKIKSQIGIKNLQVVLVNSGIYDLDLLKNGIDLEIISIPPKEFNHGKSRNLGVTKAKGDFIIIQTDDAVPINDYLYSDMCEWFLKDPKIMVVSARQIPKSDSDLISQFTINKHYFYLDLEKDSIRSSNNFDELNFEEKRKVAQIDDVCSCYRKEIFSKYKFKEIQYAEDLDMGIRLIKDGYKICQLYNTGAIHSHNRSASYHFKRGFIDSNWLFNLLGNDHQNPKLKEYQNISEFSYDVFCLYNALGNSVEIMKERKIITAKEAFEILKNGLLTFYDNTNSTETSEKQFFELLNNVFNFNSKKETKESRLLPRYYAILNRFETYMLSSNPHIINKENEFYDTLYKLLGTCIGSSLSDFYLNLNKNKSDDLNTERNIDKLIIGEV